MKIYASIIIAYISMMNLTYAQAPGYLGLHHTIQFDFSAVPTLIGPSAANFGYTDIYGEQDGGFALSTRVGISATKAISKTVSLVVEHDRYKTGLITPFNTAASAGSVNSNNGELFNRHYSFYNIINVNTALGFQFFRHTTKGAIAPLGSYIMLTGGISKISGKLLDNKIRLSKYNDSSALPLVINTNIKSYTAKFEFGINYLIGSRLLLNLSCNLRIPLLLIPTREVNIEVPFYGNLPELDRGTNQESYEYTAAKRIQLHDLLMAKIGIGLLLF